MKSDMESKIRSSMSKQAYYDTFEINQILSDVEKSAKILDSREASNWQNQQDSQKFCDQLLEEVDQISFWNKNDLSNLYLWYSPQGKWDNITNGQNQEIRAEIFDRLKNWHEYYENK